MPVPVPKFPELDGLKGKEREEAINNILRNSFAKGFSNVSVSGVSGKSRQKTFQKFLLKLRLAKETKPNG